VCTCRTRSYSDATHKCVFRCLALSVLLTATLISTLGRGRLSWMSWLLDEFHRCFFDNKTAYPFLRAGLEGQFSHKKSVRRTKQIQPHLYPPTPLSSTTMLSMKHEDYTVGWICALPAELAAAVGMLDERHSTLPSRQQDNNTYSPRGS
jgi:hypothetical protein